MAIEKELDTDFGIQANYHKMTEVHLLECGQLRMRIDSYPTIQQRIDGKEPMVKKEYVIEKADKIILGAFYSLLKASFPEFADATDMLDDSWKAVPETVEAVPIEATAEPVTDTTGTDSADAQDSTEEIPNENA